MQKWLLLERKKTPADNPLSSECLNHDCWKKNGLNFYIPEIGVYTCLAGSFHRNLNLHRLSKKCSIPVVNENEACKRCLKNKYFKFEESFLAKYPKLYSLAINRQGDFMLYLEGKAKGTSSTGLSLIDEFDKLYIDSTAPSKGNGI
jgi:hypothetical protein